MVIYRQADSRWGYLPYPKKPSTVASSGCGLLSITNTLITEPEFSTYTPKDFYDFMKQYAVVGKGTLWSGIDKGYKHFGYSVEWPDISRSMGEAWEVLNGKSLKKGTLLLRKGTRGGITWTGSGHYVCFRDYRIRNGLHEFKTADSSGRHNDGWFSYENNMRGILPQIFICTEFHGNTPRLKNTSGYTGVIPSPTLKRGTTEKTKTKQWQEFLNWTFGEKVINTPRGNFKAKTELYTKYFQKNVFPNNPEEWDGIYGKKTWKKAEAMK